MSHTNSQNIAIIGLGVVGGATYADMIESLKTKVDSNCKIFGVDVKENILNELYRNYSGNKFFGGLSKNIPSKMDVYIVSVYNPEQIEEVFKQIPKEHSPLIIVESTVPPKLSETLLKLKGKSMLALFPHRFNQNDADHRVFNLNRILGGSDKKSEEAALKFYTQFMNNELITKVPYFIAALSKPAENAYRFIEIAIAEDWKTECDRLGVDFEDLRKAMNTKWNIELKEARDGIGGTCLPKDIAFMNNFFSNSHMINAALESDEFYKKTMIEVNLHKKI